MWIALFWINGLNFFTLTFSVVKVSAHKLYLVIKQVNKYSPTFKVSKSDVSKTGEQIITVQLINPTSKEVISEGKGQNIKKAEQDASKNALIKMGYITALHP